MELEEIELAGGNVSGSRCNPMRFIVRLYLCVLSHALHIEHAYPFSILLVMVVLVGGRFGIKK